MILYFSDYIMVGNCETAKPGKDSDNCIREKPSAPWKSDEMRHRKACPWVLAHFPGYFVTRPWKTGGPLPDRFLRLWARWNGWRSRLWMDQLSESTRQFHVSQSPNYIMDASRFYPCTVSSRAGEGRAAVHGSGSDHTGINSGGQSNIEKHRQTPRPLRDGMFSLIPEKIFLYTWYSLELWYLGS